MDNVSFVKTEEAISVLGGQRSFLLVQGPVPVILTLEKSMAALEHTKLAPVLWTEMREQKPELPKKIELQHRMMQALPMSSI